ncbi:AraC family transcriptional regulator N-terminal domain-containing protein [Kutzneria kofuensis]|uniref:AraC-like DNA-binding protein n=1 Tax=Kutzneria kofuensis TaxID=103725 RepID=A0A7W9NK90_9PSEU|nr:AraC family transcriptional regulator [Kutzneria kofuensis]MBB5895131.1 AraC-like DNA-binding protein [Kutzneria kofuensis]
MLQDEFRELLARHARPDSSTAIEGVRICRTDRATAPEAAMSGTVLAIVAQGGKRLAMGDRLHDYGAGQYLVASVDLPVMGHATGPALAFGMTLEPAEIARMLAHKPRNTTARPGIAVSDATDELLDAVVRLLRLLGRPRDRAALAPLYKREILWRLLTGEQGDAVRQIGAGNRVTRAVRWIRENYPRPFRVAELAELADMSVPAFHRNFRLVTAMTPIQFQKNIRLQSARLLLANRPVDVTSVGYRVGYDSPSQFSREYRRLFGAPPSQDRASR